MAIWTGWHGSCGWNGEVMLWRTDYTLKFPDSLEGLTRLSNRMSSQLRFIMAKGVRATEKNVGFGRSPEKSATGFQVLPLY